MFPDSLKDRDNIDIFFLETTRQDGASVDEDRRTVQSSQPHQTTRHVLVAATNGHNAVKTFTTGHRFDGIGNHLA